MSPWVPRILLGAGLLIVIGTVISVSVGESGPEAPQVVGGVNEVQRTLGGFPQDEATLGSQDAEVTVSVFNDLQCGPCAQFQIDTVDALIDPYVLEDRIRLEYRHFSLAPNETTLAAIAAEAAGVQERQWQFIDTFARNIDVVDARGVTDELLREIALAVPNLEVEQWEEDRDDPEMADRVREDAVLANELGLPAEPAVVVSGPGGQRELIQTPDLAEIEAAIEEVSRG